MEKDKDKLFKWNGGKKIFQNFIGFIVLVMVSMISIALIWKPELAYGTVARELDFLEIIGMTGFFYVLYRAARFWDI